MSVLYELDKSLFLYLNSLHLPFLNPFMQFLSGNLIWIPFVGYFFWCSIQKNSAKFTFYFGLFLLLALIASDSTSSYILKNVFSRLRPCRIEDLKPLVYQFGQKCGGKYGFVSSHASNSITLVFFSVRALNFDIKKAFLLGSIPVLVSYSRIYLGVHFPGDIVGGAFVGIFWGYAFSYLYKSIQGANL